MSNDDRDPPYDWGPWDESWVPPSMPRMRILADARDVERARRRRARWRWVLTTLLGVAIGAAILASRS